MGGGGRDGKRRDFAPWEYFENQHSMCRLGHHRRNPDLTSPLYQRFVAWKDLNKGAGGGSKEMLILFIYFFSS